MERIYVRLLPMANETKKRLCKNFRIGGLGLNGGAWAYITPDQKENFEWCVKHSYLAIVPEPPRKAPIKPLTLAEQLKLIKVSPRGKKRAQSARKRK